MRTLLPLALGAAALAVPTSLAAQEDEADAPLTLADQDAPFSDMAERMQDPEQQRQMALMLRTVSEVLLDMPLAPLMESMREMTGENAPEVDPDTTLRSMSPQAERIPEEIEKNLPRALDAMGSMAEAMEKMMPALKQMAERMKDLDVPAN